MKNLVTLFLFILCFTNSFAETLFTYNKAQVNSSMEKVNQLETYVNETGFTYSEIMKQNPCEIENANLTVTELAPNEDTKLKAPFLWGCCLGPIGVLVIFAWGSKEQRKNALLGMIVPTAIFIGVIVIAIITTSGESSSLGIGLGSDFIW